MRPLSAPARPGRARRPAARYRTLIAVGLDVAEHEERRRRWRPARSAAFSTDIGLTPARGVDARHRRAAARRAAAAARPARRRPSRRRRRRLRACAPSTCLSPSAPAAAILSTAPVERAAPRGAGRADAVQELLAARVQRDLGARAGASRASARPAPRRRRRSAAVRAWRACRRRGGEARGDVDVTAGEFESHGELSVRRRCRRG